MARAGRPARWGHRDPDTPLDDLLQLPEDFQRTTFLCHYRDEWRACTRISSAGKRLLEQNKLYELVRNRQKVELATA